MADEIVEPEQKTKSKTIQKIRTKLTTNCKINKADFSLVS